MAATRSSPPAYAQADTLSPSERSVRVVARPSLTIAGPVRPGRRTKLLVSHLVRGDIALIDHRDVDRVSAEELIAAGARVVLNCKASSSGAYPNLGPQLLVEAGVVLVDLADDSLFANVADGDPLVLRAGVEEADPRAVQVLRKGELLARGTLLDRESVREETEARKREIGEALERFARNTVEHSARSASCSPDASGCRASRPTSATVRRSWSRAESATSATCARCGRSCATCAPCWSPSTAAPTRCSRRERSRT